jgi:hypothetical protein
MSALFTDKYELSRVAFSALQKIKENKSKELEEHNLQRTPKKVDYSMYLFEEYSDDQFTAKVKFDSYIYRKFITQLNEEQQEQATKVLSNILETVKSIYEHINIEPKIHGFKQITLESSESSLEDEAGRLVLDFFSKNYYNLTEHQRKEKYGQLVVETSYELMISESLSVEESVEHAYKSVMMSNFIKSINFPYLIESKINELMESDLYSEIFDRDKLFELVETFKDQSIQLSRIFSLLI